MPPGRELRVAAEVDHSIVMRALVAEVMPPAVAPVEVLLDVAAIARIVMVARIVMLVGCAVAVFVVRTILRVVAMSGLRVLGPFGLRRDIAVVTRRGRRCIGPRGTPGRDRNEHRDQQRK
jgi:hypothetical protein